MENSTLNISFVPPNGGYERPILHCKAYVRNLPIPKNSQTLRLGFLPFRYLRFFVMIAKQVSKDPNPTLLSAQLSNMAANRDRWRRAGNSDGFRHLYFLHHFSLESHSSDIFVKKKCIPRYISDVVHEETLFPLNFIADIFNWRRTTSCIWKDELSKGLSFLVS